MNIRLFWNFILFSYLIQTFIEEFESSYIPLQQKAFTHYHEQAPGVLESFGPEVKMFDITNEMGNPFQEDSQNKSVIE